MAQLESVPCDLCGAVNTHPYLCVQDRIYGLPGDFQFVKCNRCGLIYINPRPDKASIGAFYPDMDYHAFRPSSGVKAQLLNRMRTQEARSLLKGLPQKARTIEIGCGTGELLVALREQGADVLGIEPNAAAVETARKTHGLQMELGMLDDVPLEPAQFDLILMKYALEHVHSPRQTLTMIQRLLKPGGHAVFWIPNAASLDARLFGPLWRGLDAPRHLYIFTPVTIQRLLEAAGMTLQAVSYSSVPNDWAGSFEYWLEDRGLPKTVSGFLGVESLIGLAAWLPISGVAALMHTAGRMRVTAIRPMG